MINTACTRLAYVDLDRARSLIDQGPFDAIVSLAPENVPYLSGFYNMDLRLLRERLHIVVWPRGGEPTFIVMARRARLMRPDQTFIADVRGYEGEALDSMRVLAEVLKEKGLDEGVVGIEGRDFPGGHLLELRRRLPDLRFEDAVHFLDGVRAIKTPAEIEVLVKVNRLTTGAIDAAFRAARPGDTEREISARMQYEFLRGGADQVTAPLLAAGARSGMWHAMASDDRVENGMVLTTDFGGNLDGYYSDIARTVVMGKASPRQRDVHARITEIKHRIVGAIRPGMPAGEAARVGIDAYEELGLEFKWFILGHGIGMGLHEHPQLYPRVTDPILEGMTMMIETGYSDYPNESFHVEDLILVGAHGAEYLTDASRHDQIWELGL